MIGNYVGIFQWPVGLMLISPTHQENTVVESSIPVAGSDYLSPHCHTNNLVLPSPYFRPPTTPVGTLAFATWHLIHIFHFVSAVGGHAFPPPSSIVYYKFSQQFTGYILDLHYRCPHETY